VDSIIFLTLTRLVVVINFVNFSFALFTPPSRRLSTTKVLPGLAHRTVRCTRELQAELNTFENSQRRSAILHRTVRCTTGQCPVPQGRATLNSPASGIRSAIIHRTIRCDSGATTTSRATVDYSALNEGLRAQRSRAHVGGTPDSQAGSQVRAPTVGTQRPGDVAGTLDSVRWRRQQPPPTVKFGGWGYKYPNHPHIQVIQVFHSSTPHKS
jgi:hypothetical protein